MKSYPGRFSQRKPFVTVPLAFILGIGLFLFAACQNNPSSSGAVTGEVYVANMGAHSIMIYERNLNGSLTDTPVRIIRGPSTGLHNPFDVALDGLNRVWVANLGDPPATNPSITIYGPNADGNESPAFTFPLFSATSFFLPGSLSRLDGNKFLVTGVLANDVPSLSTSTLVGFSVNSVREENGSVFLGSEISNQGQLINPTGIAFNTNKAFVATSSLPLISGLYQIPGSSASAILIYDLQRNGTFSVNPTAMIFGNNTGLSNPAHMAFDQGGNLFVVNRGVPGNQNISPSITVYGVTQTGNIAPLHTIQGPNTRLNSSGSPYGIAVDNNGFIYVSTENNILVFERNSRGNVAPVHVRSNTALSGTNNADLSSPVGIAVR